MTSDEMRLEMSDKLKCIMLEGTVPLVSVIRKSISRHSSEECNRFQNDFSVQMC